MTRASDPHLGSLPARRGRLVRAGQEPSTQAAEHTHATPESLASAERTGRDAPQAARAALPAQEAARIVELAQLLAERIVGDALAVSDDALAHFALSLLAETGGARSLELFAHPEHAARLRRVLATHDFGERRLVMRDDSSLAPGELRVESPEGHVHASVASSLETLAHVALTRLAQG